MSTPKQRYRRSEAGRLPVTLPCPDCNRPGRLHVTPTHARPGELDPEVLVIWRCPEETCHKSNNGYHLEEE